MFCSIAYGETFLLEALDLTIHFQLLHLTFPFCCILSFNRKFNIITDKGGIVVARTGLFKVSENGILYFTSYKESLLGVGAQNQSIYETKNRPLKLPLNDGWCIQWVSESRLGTLKLRNANNGAVGLWGKCWIMNIVPEICLLYNVVSIMWKC